MMCGELILTFLLTEWIFEDRFCAMQIRVLTWSDKSKNAFKPTSEEIDSFIEWKTTQGFELIKQEEMTVAEYDSLKR